MNINKPGRLDEVPIITGHSGAVLDFEFNPFNDDILASCSEDQSIKIWRIPEGGLVGNMSIPALDITGHGKKVTLMRFHPTTENVLASASADQTVRLWDISTGSELSINHSHDQLIQDIVWDYCGNIYATSSKDKHVRMIDARSGELASVIENAHDGSKSVKLSFLGYHDKLLTVGFTKQSQRQFKIWDPRNTSKEVKKVDIDNGSGVIMPFFDTDTGLLYLAGKGDGNVRYYEFVNENPYCFPLSELRSQNSAKGMAWVPKRGLNVMGCETARLLKLTTNSVEPLSFLVPRKSETFQDDIYPDTAGAIPAQSASEWMNGSCKPPVLISLNPTSFGEVRENNLSSEAPKAFVPMKSAATLQKELDEAQARIKELEERLAAAGLSTA